MDALGYQDTKKVFRTIVIVVCVYAVANHAIRFLAKRYAPSGGYITQATLGSLDQFRKKQGDLLQGLQHVCPDSIEETCRAGMDQVRIVLGIQR